MIGFAEAENVKLEHITSSPLETPSNISAKCIAEVPLFNTATE